MEQPKCPDGLAPWEGQPAPQLYGFSAKDVAWALTQVAGGATYRSTAAAVRERVGRELSKLPGTSSRGGKLPPATQHGQLVSDWVEVLAPVIWSHYAPKEWPREVLLDEDTLKYSQLGKPRGLVAFYVLAVMAYTDAGQPFWAVTDGGGPVTGGARNAWPDVEMWRCEWHLLKNLHTPLPRVVRDNPADPLNGRLRYAQLSPENWNAYRADLLAAKRNGWVHHDRWTALIRKHFDVRRGRANEQRQHTDSRTAPTLR